MIYGNVKVPELVLHGLRRTRMTLGILNLSDFKKVTGKNVAKF